jgi:hypothetical protein
VFGVLGVVQVARPRETDADRVRPQYTQG